MNRRTVVHGVVLLVAVLPGTGCRRQTPETPTRGHLVVAASEAHAPLLRREAALFNSLYAEAHVDVQARSTRECFVALAQDSVRLAVADRPLNAEERAALAHLGTEATELRIGEDALGVFVHPDNALAGLDREQLADVLCGRITTWAALPGTGRTGPITVVLPGRNSGVWELLTTAFLPGVALAPARVVATEAEVLAQVLADPDAIGVASIAAWKDPGTAPATLAAAAGEPGWANGVAAATASVRAVDALVADAAGTPVAYPLHQANVHRGVYPLHFPVFLVFDPQSQLAAGFAAFVASGPGQKLVLAAGLVPATMPVRLVTLK